MDFIGLVTIITIMVIVLKLISTSTYRDNLEQKYTLSWYDPHSGELVGEREIYLYQQTVREWYQLYENDKAQDNYEVNATIRLNILKITNIEINLNHYNYELEFQE